MSKSNQLAIVVFGPQGSGKSTQVERLAGQFGLEVFETGAVLRRRAETDEALREQLSQGTLVSDEMMLEIVESELTTFDSPKGFVFDSYPRNLAEFDDFARLAKRLHWHVIGLFINLSDQSAKDRLKKRFSIVDGQKTFREDDQPEIVQKRLDIFKAETLPLKDKFKDEFVIIEINGEPAVDIVTAEINRSLSTLIDG